MANFDPIRTQRKSVAIARQITDLISVGLLSQGQRLPAEPELAKQFEVSRSVVREAIRTLEAMGCVTVHHGYGGGTFVQTTSEDYRQVAPLGYKIEDLKPAHLFDVRVRLEPFACRLAVANTDDFASLELRRLLLRMQEGDTKPALALHALVDFHIKVVELSRNALHHRIMTDLRPSILTMLADRVWSPAWRTGSRQGLSHVLDLMERGEDESADDAMSNHLSTWQAP